MPVEKFHTDRDVMLADLQQALCAQLRRSVASAGTATLFVSGGSSPVPLYRALAEEPLPWDRIDVALVDERWVPPMHAASNEGMVRTNLLRAHAAACQFTGMIVADALAEGHGKLDGHGAAAAVASCNAAYAALPRPWSAAVLGMGPDGHTASLFPGAAGLDAILASKALCAAVHAPEGGAAGAHRDRMTLTPHALLQCERLFLLITGEHKRKVYEQACTTAEHAALPVSLFLQQTTVPITVYWSP